MKKTFAEVGMDLNGNFYHVDSSNSAGNLEYLYDDAVPATMYLTFIKDDTDVAKDLEITVKMEFRAETNGGVLKPGENVNVVKAQKDQYYSFQIPKAGQISITNPNEAVLQICGKNKKELTRVSSKESKIILEKRNYHIQPLAKGWYSFSYTAKSLGIEKNTKKGKSKKVNLNQGMKGKFFLNSKKSHFYKLVLNKKKKISGIYSISKGANCSVEIYNSKGKRQFFCDQDANKNKGSFSFTGKNTFKKKKVSLEKGTYYIKITQSSRTSYGNYKLTLK